MQTRVNYLQASFFSFLIHAGLFLYLIGFFYSEKQLRPILSKAVNVNIIVEDAPAKKIEELPKTQPLIEKTKTYTDSINLNNNIKYLYDHIRILDGLGYPNAFILKNKYKIEFKNAKIQKNKTDY